MALTYAEYYGGVFAVPSNVLSGILYGPLGANLTGTLAPAVQAPPPVCNVLFYIVDADGSPIQGARIFITLEQHSSTLNGFLVQQREIRVVTDVNGYVSVPLMRKVAFTRGGIYKIQIWNPAGTKQLFNRRVTVPDLGAVNAEDLDDANLEN